MTGQRWWYLHRGCKNLQAGLSDDVNLRYVECNLGGGGCADGVEVFWEGLKSGSCAAQVISSLRKLVEQSGSTAELRHVLFQMTNDAGQNLRSTSICVYFHFPVFPSLPSHSHCVCV